MTPINTITDKVGRTISVHRYAGVIAITPNGRTAYVASVSGNINRPGYVTPINTATNTADKPIMVGVQPQALAITPNGKKAFTTSPTCIRTR